MSGIFTKWVVLQHHDVTAGDLDTGGVVRDDVVVRWIEAARDAYLDCCPVLREKAADTVVTIRCDLGAVPAGARFEGASSVSVSAGATEFWPDAFTLAIRVRGLRRRRRRGLRPHVSGIAGPPGFRRVVRAG